MTKISDILSGFRTAPVAVKTANVKPATVTRAQTRSETKRAMSAGLAQSRKSA